MRSHLLKQLEIRQGDKGTVPPSPPHWFADPNICFCFLVIFLKMIFYVKFVQKFTKIGLRLASFSKSLASQARLGNLSKTF